MKCSPLTSSSGSEQGRTDTMYWKGLAPSSCRFLTNRRNSWLRSLSMISSIRLMRSNLAFSTQFTSRPCLCLYHPISSPTRLVDLNQFRDALLILFIYFFFLNVATRIPGPTRMVDPNQSPVYSDCFHLSYQNILFMSFRFRVFNYAEAVSKGRPINIYFLYNTYTKWCTMPLHNDIQNTISYINSFVHKISHVQKK